MIGSWPAPPEFTVEETTDVRGIGGQCLRISRISDGASALLHEIKTNALRHVAATGLVRYGSRFDKPFVTRIAGPVEYAGINWIVEPLPLCVPLLSVWQSVLNERPDKAASVLRAIRLHLQSALQRLYVHGLQHGAICVENVVLTATGVYGLLQAWIPSTDRLTCVRPSGAYGLDKPLDDATALRQMLEQLATTAAMIKFKHPVSPRR